ncbi:relaxin receptor 2-like [Babylonia areolata]|uniref:relaxin receptor 2-like n=1 Tax=Babylonia areolata TaxID=304850 RepID=UPI003FD0164A
MLVLCFPFKSHLHLSTRSTMMLCCVVWGLGLFLAAVPFIGQLEFYGESSICLPLPITRHVFSGQMYSFMVFIVMNFLLFLYIGIGQLAIYWAVRKAKAAVKTKQHEEESTIARRLFLVVFTDFCCWFPVGLMGILASCGVPIPGELKMFISPNV